MPLRGRVAEYDDHKGYGELEVADGGRLFFHCTAIADGSRTIPVGVEVTYEAVTDPRGMPEAADVRPLDPVDPVDPQEAAPPAAGFSWT